MTLNQILALIPGNGWKTRVAAAGLALVGLSKAFLLIGTFFGGDVPVVNFVMDMQPSIESLRSFFEALLGLGLFHKTLKDKA